MRRNQNNICKFVEAAPEKFIVTSNFVYETHPEISSKTHLKENHIMYLVVSGSGKLTNDGKSYDLTSGTLFFTFSGIYFKIENKSELNYIYITFSGERATELFKRFSISPVNCIFEGNEGLVSFWQSSIARATEKNIDLISESVLFYTFSQLAPTEKNEEQRLTDSILEYIDLNFTDFSLNLSHMSAELGYSSKYVSRIFKQHLGMTFSSYLKHTRINYAIFLMEQGITSVKNIALLSGYNDPLYFSNVFKKETGISASQYIRQKN